MVQTHIGPPIGLSSAVFIFLSTTGDVALTHLELISGVEFFGLSKLPCESSFFRRQCHLAGTADVAAAATLKAYPAYYPARINRLIRGIVWHSVASNSCGVLRVRGRRGRGLTAALCGGFSPEGFFGIARPAVEHPPDRLPVFSGARGA